MSEAMGLGIDCLSTQWKMEKATSGIHAFGIFVFLIDVKNIFNIYHLTKGSVSDSFLHFSFIISWVFLPFTRIYLILSKSIFEYSQASDQTSTINLLSFIIYFRLVVKNQTRNCGNPDKASWHASRFARSVLWSSEIRMILASSSFWILSFFTPVSCSVNGSRAA